MNRIAQLRRSQEGFTLIELLVVVAIIALLATFAVPKLFEAINKSKGSVADSDLGTVSSALERYYFDNNAYPGASADVKTALTQGTAANPAAYLKAGTSFLNGFKRPYIYFTTTAGGAFILVDPANHTGNIQLTCGAWSATVNVPDPVPAGTALPLIGTLTRTPASTTELAPTAANLAACTTTPADLKFVTN